jgi:predicted dithiol-disulfide oxidoreductase (DUF899 family)
MSKHSVPFDSEKGPIRMSQLFEKGKDTLVLYSFMYGPKMAEPCPFVHFDPRWDGRRGAAHPAAGEFRCDRKVAHRANPEVCSRARLAEPSTALIGEQHVQPRLPRRGGERRADAGAECVRATRRRIHHFYNTELLYAPSEKGQDGRHVDMIWPLWNVFDYAPDGRGSDWNPRLSY